MHRRRLWLLAGVALAALVLAATGSARLGINASSNAKTLVFVAEQGGGPDWCLNVLLADCSSAWNVFFETPVIRGAFLPTPDARERPDLISHYTLRFKPMRVTYYIRKKARWSDGVPVTGRDWRFTWQTVIDKKNEPHIINLGWTEISSVTGEGKVVTVTFKRNYAPWKTLFGFVLPEHVLAGADIVTAWNGCICNPKTNAPISDGPFLLSRFDRGSGITLTKNRAGWFGRPAKLDSIVFRFISDSSAEIAAIRAGEVDAAYPQPQLALADLRHQPGIRVVSHLGFSLEYISMQEKKPLLGLKWVRQALISSLDRGGAAKALFGTLTSKAKPLNSLSRLSNEPGYDPKHFSKWTYSPARVGKMMLAHGCSKGSDGIFRCSGTRMSFELGSTSGNRLRELAFVIFQAQAARAGIELTNGFKPPGTFFDSLRSRNYELAMAGYAGLSPDPHYLVEIFSCDPTLSRTYYCNRKVDRLLAESDHELNEAKRLALVNRAGAIIGDDVPMIPLFQRPTFLVYRTSVHGMIDNPAQGPTFNAENWSKR
jgi:peptide/nickel transport system substrate-binding protein